jgi:hypothetical protein
MILGMTAANSSGNPRFGSNEIVQGGVESALEIS